MTQKTYQISLNFEQVLDVVLQLPEEEQEKIIQEIRKSSLKHEEQNSLSGFEEKSSTIKQHDIPKNKRAAFGVMKNSGEIIGDLVQPLESIQFSDEVREKALKKAKEGYVMTLLEVGKISSGRAGKMLGVSRLDVIEMMKKWGISPFDDSQDLDELCQEVKQMELILNRQIP